MNPRDHGRLPRRRNLACAFACVCAFAACLPQTPHEDEDRPEPAEIESVEGLPTVPWDAGRHRPGRPLAVVSPGTPESALLRLLPAWAFPSGSNPGDAGTSDAAELDATGDDDAASVFGGPGAPDATRAPDVTDAGTADVADDRSSATLGWFSARPAEDGGAPPARDAGPVVDGGPSASRFVWSNEGSPNVSEAEVPVAIDPSGTVYLARSRPDATRRVVRGAEVGRSALVGFDAEDRITVNLAPSGGLRVMSHGLVADAAGFYVLVTYGAAVELPGRRIEAPSPPGSVGRGVIAFDRAGAVRWWRALGVGAWDEGALLSGRVAGRLVVAATVRGLVTAGAASVGSASDVRLVRVDLARASGDVLGAWDLDDGLTGTWLGDVNARGELLAEVHRGTTEVVRTRLDVPVARASLYAADGRVRWTRTVPWGAAALDEVGRSYFAGATTCLAWTSAAARSVCVASLEETGEARWISVVLPSGRQDVSSRIAWRSGALDVFSEGWVLREWRGLSGLDLPRCEGWDYTPLEARVGEDGQILEARDASRSALGRVEGGGRRCEWTVAWQHVGCGIVPRMINQGALVCSRSTGPSCASNERSCGGRCVATDSDPYNCGACGRSCVGAFPGAAGYCRQGACVYGVCDAGRASCDGDADNGCEVDLARDNVHCGFCARACLAGSTCTGGRCCAGGRCTHALASEGREGAFAPMRDVTLSSGVHHYATVTIPAGVTVRTDPGAVLELRATGDVRIDGVIDLRGRDGECCETPGGGCGSFAPPGPFPGTSGNGFSSWSCGPRAVVPWPPPILPMPPMYACEGTRIQLSGCGDGIHTPYGYVSEGGTTAGCGSIGLAAFEDLAVNRIFTPGSRGGSFSGTFEGFPSRCALLVGGGGGGALRVVSETRIALGATARLLASGGASGGPGAKGGSGGVVALHAPEVRVPSGAVLDASGETLGRVRVSVDPSRCQLAGTVRPPLVNGCRETPSELAVEHAMVTRWPL